VTTNVEQELNLDRQLSKHNHEMVVTVALQQLKLGYVMIDQDVQLIVQQLVGAHGVLVTTHVVMAHKQGEELW
jgi:hypothetical protein